MTGLPLLEKHRVRVRLIFSLLTIPSPEMQARVQVLLAVVDMDLKGPIPALPTFPSLATWLLVPPCYQLNLESCLRS